MADATVKVRYIGDTTQLDQSFRKVGAGAKATGDQVERAGARMGQAFSGNKFADNISSMLNAFNINVGPVENVRQLTDATQGLGSMLPVVATAAVSAFAAVGAAVVGATIAAYQLGSQFDEAFDSIQIKTGATGAELESLGEDFRGVFGALPVSMEDAAAAVGTLGARLSGTGANIQILAEDIARIGQLTGEDVSGAANSAADAFYRWNVPTEQQHVLLNQLFAVSQAAGVSFGQLTGDVAASAASLQQFGFSAAEAAAWMGAIAKTGGDTGKVMGGFSKALVKLSQNQLGLSGTYEDSASKAATAGTSMKNAARAARDAARSVADAQDRLRDANNDLFRTLFKTIPREQVRARQQLSDATDNVTEANERLIEAQRNLTKAMQGPDEDEVAAARRDLAEATDAVSIAQGRLTQAQVDLSRTDPRRNADAHRDALLGVEEAQAALRSAQNRSIDAQQKLTDLTTTDADELQKVADAKKDVRDAERNLTRTQQARKQLEEDLIDRLGRNLDGSVLLADARDKVAGAERGVRDALQSQADQASRAGDAAAKLAAGLEEVRGIGPLTKGVLEDLGLAAKPIKEQFEGLVKWLVENPTDPLAIGVAAELFSTKSGPEAIKALKDMYPALDAIKSKSDKGGAAIGDMGVKTDDAAEKWRRMWNKIKLVAEPIASAVFDYVGRVADSILLVFTSSEAIFSGLFGWMATLSAGFIDGISRAWGVVTGWIMAGVRIVKTAINGLITVWNAIDFGWDFSSWPSILFPPGFPQKVNDIIPDIPKLAKGGIATRPTLALIGEAGPEAVVPLNRANGYGGGGSVNITVNAAPLTNPAEIGRKVKDVLLAYEQRNGKGWRQ